MRISSRALGAALAMAAAMTASTAGAERLSLDLQVREAVNRILESDFKACKAQSGRLTKLIADPQFTQQVPRTQALAYFAVIHCAPKYTSPEALAAARGLVKLPVDPRLTYTGHYGLLIDAENRDATDEYLAQLNAIIDGDPSLIADWKARSLQWILVRVKDDPVKEIALLDRLHAVPWTDATALDADRNSWAVRRARRFVEAGEKAKARSVLESVTHVDALLTVAQDRRFEPLWPDLEADGRFAWVKIAEAELASEQARMKAEPNTLEPVSDTIGSLQALGRYDEALALGEAYAARLRNGDTFTDAKDQRAWMLNSLAYIYFDLGRYDEADKVVLEAVDQDRVSQTINRAIMLNRAAKPAEALKALDAVDVKQAAKYGLMYLDSTKTCAHAQLGDKASAEALVATMRPRWKDNATALSQALLCLDAQDELAALYVRRLEDPTERATVLSAFRTGIPAPTRAPYAATLEARGEAVRARPEVVAALRKWGRALKVPLYGDV
jgi:tetratricopeptide (TPR) repeat protein